MANDDYPAMSDTPIDLSRRCDSVETRKTPSPYSSAFGSCSPSLMNDSPTSSHNASISQHRRRSHTPTHHFNSAEYMRARFTIPANDFEPKIEAGEDYHMQHRLMQNPINETTIPSYLLDIDPVQLEMQRKLMEIPAATASVLAAQSPNPQSLNTKSSRPFKAYQENPFLSDLMVDENYAQFRDQTLEAIRQQNGGQLTVSNPRMRRNRQRNDDIASSQSDDASNAGNGDIGPIKDNAYYERRRKNNEAAKKSRDRRRQKEDELALRTTYLEHENMLLRVQLSTIKKQLAQMFDSHKKSI